MNFTEDIKHVPSFDNITALSLEIQRGVLQCPRSSRGKQLKILIFNT